MALVGLVVVSHSRRLAEAAVELAMDMVHGEPPAVEIAAGMPDGGFGTDATAVADAIGNAEAGAGVVVLVDLGSAVMSAEMALDFLEDADAVRIVPAPFVEGLLAAVVVAASGGELDAVAAEAAGSLRPKLEALAPDDPPPPSSSPAAADFRADASAEATICNRAGLHARPAAHLASTAAGFEARVRVTHTGTGKSALATPIGLATLGGHQGDTLRIEAEGPDAEAAVQALVALVADGFGEDTAAASPTGPQTVSSPLGVSPGRVVGPARVLRPAFSKEPPARRIAADDVPAEQERLGAAIEAVADDYRARAAQAEPEAAAILAATADLAADATLRAAATDAVGSGKVGAETAFWHAVDEAATSLRQAGGLLAERVSDLTDIRNRVVSRLLDVPLPGMPQTDGPFVLIARDLAPADTAALDPATCLAIVTAEGGPTSHTSILARSLGIPAVVGAASALEVCDGTQVVVDGTSGEVVPDPTAAQRDGARTAPATLRPLERPGATADGTEIPLLANVGSGRDAELAARAGAQGVGLFRTEFCFLDRPDEPSIGEQVTAYRQVLDAFGNCRVVVRTLDAGSDKPLPFLTTPGEPNPSLGVRGFRTAWEHRDVLERQLEAIGRAARDTPADVWVMAPMIATPDEAADFAALCRAAGLQKVGVMVETPSAALLADQILAHVDFVSIGTNDLTQYVMAADRQLPALGALQDPSQPAVLKLIGMIGEAGRRAGKPVGVCGEAAADPHLAPVLVGLGVTSLSMGARALPIVADALAAVSDDECERLAGEAVR